MKRGHSGTRTACSREWTFLTAGVDDAIELPGSGAIVGEKSREQILKLQEIALASRSPHGRPGARRFQPTRVLPLRASALAMFHNAPASASVAFYGSIDLHG